MKVMALILLYCSSLLPMDIILEFAHEAQFIAVESSLKRHWHSIEKNDFKPLEAILTQYSNSKDIKIRGYACLYLGAIYTRPPCWDPPQASRYLLAAKDCRIGFPGEKHANELLRHIEFQLNIE